MKAALDQLQELGLKTMAASLEDFYNSPDFNNTGRLELISRIIGDEYDARMTSRYEGRLRKAKLKGCACSLDKCVDTKERQYQPDEIVKTLSRMQFVKDGMNLFILGPSDSGKTYLAKALGIAACRDYRVLYYHCEELSADLSDLRKHDYDKYKRELKKLSTIDLLILDDFCSILCRMIQKLRFYIRSLSTVTRLRRAASFAHSGSLNLGQAWLCRMKYLPIRFLSESQRIIQ